MVQGKIEMKKGFGREKMGRGKIAMKGGFGREKMGRAMKKVSSSNVSSTKRRACLFKKAYELSVLCDTEVAIILFSADGQLFEFATSDMKSILKRFKTSQMSPNRPALKFKPEEPMEVDALSEEALVPTLKKWKLLGKDLTHMGLHELLALEEKLTEGMLHVKDRKVQILTEQVEQSRMQEQHALQTNQSLQKMVEELQGVFPSISCPMPPLSVHFPEAEGNADTRFVPSTSYAVPLAIDNGPETEATVRPAYEDWDTTLALGRTWDWSRYEDIRN